MTLSVNDSGLIWKKINFNPYVISYRKPIQELSKSKCKRLNNKASRRKHRRLCSRP